MKVPDVSPISRVTLPVSDDLELVFKVHTETYLTVNATVNGPLELKIDIKTDGIFTISKYLIWNVCFILTVYVYVLS